MKALDDKNLAQQLAVTAQMLNEQQTKTSEFGIMFDLYPLNCRDLPYLFGESELSYFEGSEAKQTIT